MSHSRQPKQHLVGSHLGRPVAPRRRTRIDAAVACARRKGIVQRGPCFLAARVVPERPDHCPREALVVDELVLERERLIVVGPSLIAIGATGCILTVKAMYELQRTRKRYALITMCIGGGQGIAAIIERM